MSVNTSYGDKKWKAFQRRLKKHIGIYDDKQNQES